VSPRTWRERFDDILTCPRKTTHGSQRNSSLWGFYILQNKALTLGSRENVMPPLKSMRGGILLSCLKNIQGAPAKSRRSPLGQRVLMLFACVHHDIAGADRLAKAIVVDHGLNAICIF